MAVLILSVSVMVLISNQATLVNFAQQAHASWLLLVGGRNALVKFEKEEFLRAGRPAPQAQADQASGAQYTYKLKEVSDQSALRDNANLKLVELTISRGKRTDSFVTGFCELPPSKAGDDKPKAEHVNNQLPITQESSTQQPSTPQSSAGQAVIGQLGTGQAKTNQPVLGAKP
jgi:hypothetical protein